MLCMLCSDAVADTGMIHSAGLTSYVRAGMGSLVTDTACLSKAALSSSARAFKKLGTRSSQSSTSAHTAADDLQRMSVNDENNLDRAMYGTKYDADIASGKIPLSSALNPATASDAMPSDAAPTQLIAQQQACEDIFACKLQSAMPPSIEERCPEVAAARGMFHKLMVDRGLDTEDSDVYKQSLPELVRMTPDAKTATSSGQSQPNHSGQATGSQSPAAATAASTGGGGSSGGGGGEDPFAANEAFSNSDRPQQSFDMNLALHSSSNQGERTAYGGEAGEQWVGSQSPDRVATAGVAVAAENEAAAQSQDVGALQRLEEGSSGRNDRNSFEQGQALPAILMSNRVYPYFVVSIS